ncbi:hypothetical protein EST38_g12908 [Candolleomyces aberdarensis]|uniref:Uncharacterized protein n=1 Tax=Candolleomyces aberdarensis TaxID=2316362 RepID=A0A4Q2D3C7_9AGAR|nr:hypothetical protein EST38_g12908 [Candolleomyces aberdarensis]
MVVWQCLSTAAVFKLKDRVMKNEVFYAHLLDFLEDSKETDEVTQLLAWWDEQIFPEHLSDDTGARVPQTSALANLRARCKILSGKALQQGDPPQGKAPQDEGDPAQGKAPQGEA